MKIKTVRNCCSFFSFFLFVTSAFCQVLWWVIAVLRLDGAISYIFTSVCRRPGLLQHDSFSTLPVCVSSVFFKLEKNLTGNKTTPLLLVTCLSRCVSRDDRLFVFLSRSWSYRKLLHSNENNCTYFEHFYLYAYKGSGGQKSIKKNCNYVTKSWCKRHYKKSEKRTPVVYHVNMKELSILIFHCCLRIAMCCVYGFKEMSVKLNGKCTGNFLIGYYLYCSRFFFIQCNLITGFSGWVLWI